MKNRLGKWGNLKCCSKPTFPPFIQHFGDDFTILSTFVPTYSLEHLKNCGKNTKKLAASSKGLRILSSVHDVKVCASTNSEDDVITLLECLLGSTSVEQRSIFSISFSQKLALEMSSGVRLTWSSAMLVILNLTRGLLSLTSMQLPVFFSGITVK